LLFTSQDLDPYDGTCSVNRQDLFGNLGGKVKIISF